MSASGLPWDERVTTSDVILLHRVGIERFGGDGTIRTTDRDCVDGRLGSAWNAEIYRGEVDHQYAGLVFAGYALFYLAKAHCFVDGNKRVSWTTAMYVLASMGLTVDASADEAEQMIAGLLAPGSRVTGDDIVAWLAERLISAPRIG